MPARTPDDLFRTSAEVPSPRIRVGTGGWTYAPWRNNFFPNGLVQRRELEYASRQLTAIEVNGTYYGAQKPAVYAKWREETPDGFVFSLKAPRHSTDRKTLSSAGELIDTFISGGLSELGDRLGPILWQLPDRKPFESDDLRGFLDLLPESLNGQALRHVLEVRHPSFACEEYINLARERRFPTVYTDSPSYPSFADLTGDFVYARLMRSEAEIESGYSSEALDEWAIRAKRWRDGHDPAQLPHLLALSKPRPNCDVFIYFINGAKERAPHAAMSLIDRLAQ